ncbi:hypothetical protein SDC9_198007 [bioreactor metagenome]|uniref:Uncharacterized protein n=1 Tax=bioreactor metagenome TaxID=1076179 RepID=A0A645IGE8_9ZZZZ
MSLPDHFSALDRKYLVGSVKGKVYVMGHQQDRHPLFFVDSLYKFQRLYLMPVIKKTCRLIQKKDIRTLCQGRSYKCLLAFASAEAVELAIGNIRNTGRFQ